MKVGGGVTMAKIERNKKATNPNRRPMSVMDMTHPIIKENGKVLKLLDELDSKKNLFLKFWC